MQTEKFQRAEFVQLIKYSFAIAGPLPGPVWACAGTTAATAGPAPTSAPAESFFKAKGARDGQAKARELGAKAMGKQACRKIEFIVNSKREAANGRLAGKQAASLRISSTRRMLEHTHTHSHTSAHTNTDARTLAHSNRNECHASCAMSRTAPKKLFSRSANFWRALSSDGCPGWAGWAGWSGWMGFGCSPSQVSMNYRSSFRFSWACS